MPLLLHRLNPATNVIVPSNDHPADVRTLQLVTLAEDTGGFDEWMYHPAYRPWFKEGPEQEKLLTQVSSKDFGRVHLVIERAIEAGLAVDGVDLGTQPLLAKQSCEHAAEVWERSIYGLGSRVAFQLHLGSARSLHQGQAQYAVHLLDR